jgi:curved DNA-binding protein CbpA
MKAGKNHYQVLDIPVNASLSEIKKAYRKLALVFHPDKHPDPIIAIPKFNEIKEAYQVLVNPSSRRDYDREFHFQKYQVKQMPLASEADEVLQLTKELWAKFKYQDPFRLDQDLLYFQLNQLLSGHNIRLLNNKGNTILDQEIIAYLMDCSMALPIDKKKALAQSWQMIARDNPTNTASIQTYLKHAQIWTIWENYKMHLALGLALFICLGIYLLG